MDEITLRISSGSMWYSAAVLAAMGGAVVRRKAWENPQALGLRWKGAGMFWTFHGSFAHSLTDQDIAATDWEVVAEEKSDG